MNRSLRSFLAAATVLLILVFQIHTASAQSLDQATRLLNIEKTDEAITMLQGLSQSNPMDIQTNFLLAKTLLKAGRKDDAIAIFQKLASGTPNTAETLLGAAQILILNNNVAAAKGNLDKVARLAKKDAVITRIVGESLLLAEKPDYAMALDFLNKAQGMAKKDPDIYRALAELYIQQNNAGKAVTQLEYVAEFDPTDASAHYAMGKIWERAKNEGMALQEYEKTIAQDPKFAAAYRRIIDIYRASFRWSDVQQRSADLVAAGLAEKSDWRNYVNATFFAKDYAALTDIVPKALALYPEEAYLYRLLGYAQYEKNDAANALTTMKTFFERQDPAKVLGLDYEYLGKIYEKLGVDSMAVVNYEKVVTQYDSTGTKKELWGTIASMYYKLKKWGAATNAFEQKIASKPDKVSDRDVMMLGYCQFYNKQYPSADATFAKLIEMRPDLPAGNYWRGFTQQLMENDANRAAGLNEESPNFKTGAAKPYYDKFIEMIQTATDPNQYKNNLMRIYPYLITYYGVNKDKDNTITYLKKYIEIKPDAQFYKDLLAQIEQYGFATTVPVTDGAKGKPKTGGQ